LDQRVADRRRAESEDEDEAVGVAKTLISLIGEQPIPNLLPLLHQPPEVALLVHSERTRQQAHRVGGLAPDQTYVEYLSVDAYNIAAATQDLDKHIRDAGWHATELVFNLTGGTKAMVLAAFAVAKEYRSEFLYLQTEAKKTHVYRYGFDEQGTVRSIGNGFLPVLIDINTYIRVHLGRYQPSKGPKNDFERVVRDAVRPAVDEVVGPVNLGGALEVDLIVRCENQVGIIEAKTGNVNKTGIDQLNTAAGREFLGTYTRKFLVYDRSWDKTHSNLSALAKARGIVVIPVQSYGARGAINKKDADRLGQTVRRELIGDVGGGA
jgi:hypothetical protein